MLQTYVLLWAATDLHDSGSGSVVERVRCAMAPCLLQKAPCARMVRKAKKRQKWRSLHPMSGAAALERVQPVRKVTYIDSRRPVHLESHDLPTGFCAARAKPAGKS